MDACFRKGSDPKGCFVYHTYSDVKGLGRVHYYFSDDATRALTPETVYIDDPTNYIVYNWYALMPVPHR